MERGWTVRLTPAERCLPESASERRVVAGSATTRRSIPLSSPLWGLTPCRRRASKSVKDALDSDNARFRSLHMHGVGAKIDADAKRVFHKPEVFIASPEQGLEVGRDLQSDLQRFR